MNNREKWRERVRDIRAGGTTWWWWWTVTRKQKWEKITLWISQTTNLRNLTWEDFDIAKERKHLEWNWISSKSISKQRLMDYVKAKIDKPQKDSKSGLCINIFETIYHLISECRKLVPKVYKTRHEWVGKVIHWEVCKKLKFDHTNKWYIHNL